jgi:hypothetical protein
MELQARFASLKGQGMRMVRLVYISTLTEACTAEERRNILEHARAHNPQSGLTGILCWKNGYFLRWLEGERSKVNNLYRSVINDERHTDVQLVDYGEVSGRTFSDWSMAYIGGKDLTDDVLFNFSFGSEFNPYEMSGGMIRGLLEEVGRVKKEVLHRLEEQLGD